MRQITIYHNPNCGTSRNVLEIIRNSGEEPKIVWLKNSYFMLFISSLFVIICHYLSFNWLAYKK